VCGQAFQLIFLDHPVLHDSAFLQLVSTTISPLEVLQVLITTNQKLSLGFVAELGGVSLEVFDQATAQLSRNRASHFSTLSTSNIFSTH
jgi:hypothetical protein